jgi:uncharacterized protein (DUF305 family)
VASPGNESTPRTRRWAVRGAAAATIVAVGAAALVILSGSAASPNERARAADIGYIDAALRQHRACDTMTAIALVRSSRREVRALAARLRDQDLLTAQLLASLHRQISGRPAQLADGTIVPHRGLPGPFNDPAPSSSNLRPARPFDRAFLDRMIAGRLKLLRLARKQSLEGGDRTLREFNRDLQRRYRDDVRQMRALREAWYGPASAARSSGRRDTPAQVRQAPGRAA